MNTLAGEGLSIPGRSIKNTPRDCITLWRAKGLFYHDFPADEANIDYILIGSAGFFCYGDKPQIKKESRPWPIIGRRPHDGKRLTFPKGYDINALTQGKDQPPWLGKWLTSTVGEEVSVEPIVTLPGWDVKRSLDSCA